MKKISFAFLKNKSFLAGLISGVIITALAAILIFSLSYPPVGSNKAKGTIVPELGQTGSVQSSGTDCGYIYVNVLFGSEGDNVVLHCHADFGYPNGTTVQLNSMPPGAFCQGGGPWVSDGSAPLQN